MPKLVDLVEEQQKWESGDANDLMLSIVCRMKLISPAVAFAYRPELILKAALYVAVETARRLYGPDVAMAKIESALDEVKDSALAG